MNNHPNWLIFFRGVGIPPTSQNMVDFTGLSLHVLVAFWWFFSNLVISYIPITNKVIQYISWFPIIYPLWYPHKIVDFIPDYNPYSLTLFINCNNWNSQIFKCCVFLCLCYEDSTSRIWWSHVTNVWACLANLNHQQACLLWASLKHQLLSPSPNCSGGWFNPNMYLSLSPLLLNNIPYAIPMISLCHPLLLSSFFNTLFDWLI